MIMSVTLQLLEGNNVMFSEKERVMVEREMERAYRESGLVNETMLQH